MNPYAILGVVVAWAGSLIAVGYWQNNAGHTAERVSWQARENTELTAANAKIVTLETQARTTEQANATALAQIGGELAKEKEDAKAQHDADAAAAFTGSLRLSFNATGTIAGISTPGQTPTGARGDHGASAIELPPALTAGLFALADDADQVADQLRACQAVVVADRLVNAP